MLLKYVAFKVFAVGAKVCKVTISHQFINNIVHQSFYDLVVAGPSKTMGCARCIWSSASWLSPSVPDDGVC